MIEDERTGKHNGRVLTRFPPEPNGYLHLGHAKSICLNFGLAKEFGGATNLRFDDTNPEKEEQEYVDSIIDNVKWLGFQWQEPVCFASDYFQQLYDWAVQLIKAGKAYVDDQTPDEMRINRGTLTEPGKASPFRDRSADENLALFRDMRAGKFAPGARVLRAKIDMASGNINLRDPALYRIIDAPLNEPLMRHFHAFLDWGKVVSQQEVDTVRLDDVASIEDGFTDLTQVVRANGEPAVVFEIAKASGANTVATSRGVHERLEHALVDLARVDARRKVEEILERAALVARLEDRDERARHGQRCSGEAADRKSVV